MDYGPAQFPPQELDDPLMNNEGRLIIPDKAINYNHNIDWDKKEMPVAPKIPDYEGIESESPNNRVSI